LIAFSDWILYEVPVFSKKINIKRKFP